MTLDPLLAEWKRRVLPERFPPLPAEPAGRGYQRAMRPIWSGELWRPYADLSRVLAKVRAS